MQFLSLVTIADPGTGPVLGGCADTCGYHLQTSAIIELVCPASWLVSGTSDRTAVEDPMCEGGSMARHSLLTTVLIISSFCEKIGCRNDTCI